MRRFVRIGVSAVLVAGATAGAAVAATTDGPGSPASGPGDITAPVEGATRWLEGPAQDTTDPAVGAFSFGSGFAQVPGRAADRLAHTDPSEAGFRALAQDAYDSLLHMKPDTPLTHSLDTGHPAYTPDWDHDGVYGEAEDYDHDVDGVPDVARFRYPCTGIDGVVSFEHVDGGCGPDTGDGRLRTGLVREARIVDSRGFILDASIWLPGEAIDPTCPAVPTVACVDPSAVRPGLPSVVFHNGLSSRQDHYYWFATALARAGYAVLTYDPAGQGESEGTMLDLMDSHGGFLSGVDAQDAVRWWVGDDVQPIDVGQSRPFTGFHDPRYTDAGGDQVRNPYRDVLDHHQVSISGHSMGAAATVTYLNALTDGRGADGRPVPPIAAAVPFSIPGETRVTAPAPVLMVSGDLDGVPLVAPAVAGTGWADDHERMYATLRHQAPAQPVGVVIIEGGVHTDQVDQPYIAATTWGIAVAERYTLAFLDCHARGVAGRCAPLGQTSPHLSRSFATQYDPDGSGAAANVCVQAPDQASLGQEVPALRAALGGQHAACDS
jgi:alpha-beta hydrolase superfamily lysophospholipase